MGQVNEIPSGFMKDAQGRLVPLGNIKEIDKERDALVREIVAKAKQVAGSLESFKREALGDIQAFAELSAERYEVKLGGVKGNIDLTTFDGEYRVRRAMADVLAVDERILAVKALFDACINGWAEGSNDNLRALLNHAFRMDREGNLNIKALLGLRQIQINDPKWNAAMEALAETIRVVQTREYIRIYKRDATGKYQQMNLDVSGV